MVSHSGSRTIAGRSVNGVVALAFGAVFVVVGLAGFLVSGGHPAVGTDEHGGRRSAGGPFPEIEAVRLAGAAPKEQEPAAAKVSRLRMDHGEGERHRHGGVDRVAAVPQDIAADLARDGMAGHHHGAGRLGDARAAEQRPVERNSGGVLLAGEWCGRGDGTGDKQS